MVIFVFLGALMLSSLNFKQVYEAVLTTLPIRPFKDRVFMQPPRRIGVHIKCPMRFQQDMLIDRFWFAFYREQCFQ